MVETLNELGQLTKTRFGQPWPRHGLKLLYWFANECISFENNEMHFKCDPEERDYGFHLFENRHDKYGQLLPGVDIPYYVVGNLNSRGAYQLPTYVSEDKSDDLFASNKDRIIVSVDDEEWIEKVYVTQHIDKSNYNPNATFQISKGLLLIIRNMTLKEFLCKTGYSTRQVQKPVQPVLQLNYIPVPTTSNIAVVPPAILPQHRPAQINDIAIQIDPVNNTTKQKENIPQKGFLDWCTIL